VTRRALTPEDLKNTWDLAVEFGQREAARRLHVTQGAVQRRMWLWVGLAEIDLPDGRLPGYMTHEERSAIHRDQDTIASLRTDMLRMEAVLTDRIEELERKVRRLAAGGTILNHRRVADGGMTVREQKKAMRYIAQGERDAVE